MYSYMCIFFLDVITFKQQYHKKKWHMESVKITSMEKEGTRVCSKIKHYLTEAEWRIYALVNYTINGSGNGLSPGRRQAIIWTNDGILLTGPLGTNLIEISTEVQKILFNKMHLQRSSRNWRPIYLGLSVIFATWK